MSVHEWYSIVFIHLNTIGRLYNSLIIHLIFVGPTVIFLFYFQYYHSVSSHFCSR
jgi:hypothetical protein